MWMRPGGVLSTAVSTNGKQGAPAFQKDLRVAQKNAMMENSGASGPTLEGACEVNSDLLVELRGGNAGLKPIVDQKSNFSDLVVTGFLLSGNMEPMWVWQITNMLVALHCIFCFIFYFIILYYPRKRAFIDESSLLLRRAKLPKDSFPRFVCCLLVSPIVFPFSYVGFPLPGSLGGA